MAQTMTVLGTLVAVTLAMSCQPATRFSGNYSGMFTTFDMIGNTTTSSTINASTDVFDRGPGRIEVVVSGTTALCDVFMTLPDGGAPTMEPGQTCRYMNRDIPLLTGVLVMNGTMLNVSLSGRYMLPTDTQMRTFNLLFDGTKYR